MQIEYNGYLIKPHKQYPSNYVIVTQGVGGKIPDILGGLFTSTSIAKREVDKYLYNKVKKDTVNAKTISKD